MAATDQLSVIFGALADPTRRAILARLADGDATVTELAEPFSISLPAISRHLKVLEKAGLIARSRSGQWRSSTLQAAPFREATAWMEQYRQFWDTSFDRLDVHLRRVQQAGGEQAGAEQAGAEQAVPRRPVPDRPMPSRPGQRNGPPNEADDKRGDGK